MKKSIRNTIFRLGLISSLTLGLAPFSPEPHIIGKLKWLAGGANGMTSVDYFDLLLHGIPWLVLFFGIGLQIAHFINRSSTSRN